MGGLTVSLRLFIAMQELSSLNLMNCTCYVVTCPSILCALWKPDLITLCWKRNSLSHISSYFLVRMQSLFDMQSLFAMQSLFETVGLGLWQHATATQYPSPDHSMWILIPQANYYVHYPCMATHTFPLACSLTVTFHAALIVHLTLLDHLHIQITCIIYLSLVLLVCGISCLTLLKPCLSSLLLKGLYCYHVGAC